MTVITYHMLSSRDWENYVCRDCVILDDDDDECGDIGRKLVVACVGSAFRALGIR